MATWQYTFLVLPNKSVITLSSNHFHKLENELFDDEFFWERYPYQKDFFNKIDLILKKGRSWDTDSDLYGNQESNFFEVLSNDDGNVLSISFRIDFRTNYEPILRQIIEFCCLNGFIILDESLTVVPLNYAQVRNIIETSPQVRKYNSLAKGNKKI